MKKIAILLFLGYFYHLLTDFSKKKQVNDLITKSYSIVSIDTINKIKCGYNKCSYVRILVKDEKDKLFSFHSDRYDVSDKGLSIVISSFLLNPFLENSNFCVYSHQKEGQSEFKESMNSCKKLYNGDFFTNINSI